MKPFARCIIVALCLLVLAADPIALAALARAEEGGKVRVVLYWGDGCPVCKKEFAYLEGLLREYPEVELLAYEVWKNKENALVYAEVLKQAGVRQASVPVTIIGRRIWLGFSDESAADMRAYLDSLTRPSSPGPGSGAAYVPPREGASPFVAVPVLGRVNAQELSLPVFAVVLGLLDGFNPCAFFVLLFLLSLMVHARSRARMLMVGGVFVAVSGIVYFLFMAAWLNMFLLVGRVSAITTVAGLLAVGMASVNIKDFFLFGRGPSLSIPEGAKPRLFERMRGLLRSASLMSMLTGAVVLAVVANGYELLCTAGFPMVFTRVLTLRALPASSYYWLLLLYNAVYVLPLLVIVVGFAVTLGSRKLTEWQGRVLKLVSGVMMLALGGVLLVRPGLLGNVFVSFALLAGAVGVSAAVAVAYRRFRPDLAKG